METRPINNPTFDALLFSHHCYFCPCPLTVFIIVIVSIFIISVFFTAQDVHSHVLSSHSVRIYHQFRRFYFDSPKLLELCDFPT